MNKQKIYTVAGIALSFGIAAGGWALTSRLLDIKSNQLLSASGVTWIYAPAVSPAETPNTAENTSEPSGGLPVMTESEMVSVLRSRVAYSVRMEQHAPMAEQIGMEDAIIIGERALTFLGSEGFIPAEQLAFDKTKTTAFLNRYIPANTNEPLIDFDSVYSFWTVTFNGEDKWGFLTSAHITINAVTGKIWDLYIPIGPYVTVKLGIEDITDALTRYVEYMGISNYEGIGLSINATFSPPCIIAFTTFAGGDACAVIRVEGRPLPTTESETTLVGVHIYLDDNSQRRW